MWLNRTTPDPFYGYRTDPKVNSAVCSDFEASSISFSPKRAPMKVVIASFPRYGNAPKRRSDFALVVHWGDVEGLIERFCEAGQSEALAIRDAVRLAEAAKELGWHPPDDAPQSN
jgi:hypothetical protein